MKVGQQVTYTVYGKSETATIQRVSRDGKVLFLDNGRWMHAESCTVIRPDPSAREA